MAYPGNVPSSLWPESAQAQAFSSLPGLGTMQYNAPGYPSPYATTLREAVMPTLPMPPRDDALLSVHPVKSASQKEPRDTEAFRSSASHAPDDSDMEMEDGEVSSDHERDVGRQAQESAAAPQAVARSPLNGSLPQEHDPLSLAHNLVREMHAWGLSFQDLVDEGLNADLLRKIYADYNIPMIESLVQRANLPKMTPEDNEAQSMRKQTNETDYTQPVPELVQNKAEIKDSQLLDRKALIAQKLAAKTAKKPVNAKAEQSKELVTPSPSVNRAALPLHPDLQLQADLKRRRQTELARQKMEALKVRSIAQRVTQRPLDLGLSPKHTPADALSSEAIVAPSAEQNESHDTAHILSHESHNSQLASFSIPGLFAMTSGQSSLVPSTQPVASDDASVFDISSSQPERQRQKASDFMDSPPKFVTRSLLQNDAGVVIDISDEEDAVSDQDASDNDVHDGRHNSRTLRSPQLPSTVRPETSRRGMIETSQSVPDHTLSGKSSSDGLVSTPVFREPRELKKTEHEIESMNRRIAELEERIKSKQARTTDASMRNPVEDEPLKHVTTDKNINSLVTTAEPEQPATFNDDTMDVQSDKASQEETLHSGHIVAASKPTDDSATLPLLPSEKPLSEIEQNSHHKDAGTSVDEPAARDETVTKLLELRAPQYTNITNTRKAEIAQGLPLLDDEITKTRLKLREIREQEARLIRDIEQGIRGKQMLTNELQRLSDEATPLEALESMPEDLRQSDLDDVQSHVLRSLETAVDVMQANITNTLQKPDLQQRISDSQAQNVAIGGLVQEFAVHDSTLNSPDAVRHAHHSDSEDGSSEYNPVINEEAENYEPAEFVSTDSGEQHLRRPISKDGPPSPESRQTHSIDAQAMQIDVQMQSPEASIPIVDENDALGEDDDEDIYEPPNDIAVVTNASTSDPSPSGQSHGLNYKPSLDETSSSTPPGELAIVPSNDSSSSGEISEEDSAMEDMHTSEHNDPTAVPGVGSTVATQDANPQDSARSISDNNAGLQRPLSHFSPYESPLKHMRAYCPTGPAEYI